MENELTTSQKAAKYFLMFNAFLISIVFILFARKIFMSKGLVTSFWSSVAISVISIIIFVSAEAIVRKIKNIPKTDERFREAKSLEVKQILPAVILVLLSTPFIGTQFQPQYSTNWWNNFFGYLFLFGGIFYFGLYAFRNSTLVSRIQISKGKNVKRFGLFLMIISVVGFILSIVN